MKVVTEISPPEGAEIFDQGLFTSACNLDCQQHVLSVCTTLFNIDTAFFANKVVSIFA